jgi:hypothetical protein
MPEQSNVRKLVDDAPVVKVVATAFSLTVGLTPDKQLTFQSGFEGDEPREVVNARMDAMLYFADRIRSRYEIPEAEEELAKQQETVANLKFDLDRLDKQHEHDQAARKVELATLDSLLEDDVKKAQETVNLEILNVQKTREGVHANGVAAHQRSGRMGSYVPAGAAKADLAKCDQALETLKGLRETQVESLSNEYAQRRLAMQAEIDKAENERTLHRDNQGVSLERWGKAIVDQEAKLARLKAAASG